MSDILGLLAFLGSFHIIGGIVAGSALRRGIQQGWSCRLPFMVLWGIAFGGIPSFIGVTWFVRRGVPYLIAVQVLVFVGALLATALIPNSALDLINLPALLPIVFGGVFMMIGVILFMAIVGDSLPYALLALAAFGGTGAVVFVTSAVKALRG